MATSKGLLTTDERVSTAGLPSTNVWSAHYDPDTAILQVSLFGTGMFWQSLAPAAKTPQVAPEARTIRASPNPFVQGTSLALEVPRAATEVTLEVFDVTGRRVRTLRTGALGAGSHAITWDGNDAAGRKQAQGIYFARLVVDGDVSVNKLVRVD